MRRMITTKQINTIETIERHIAETEDKKLGILGDAEFGANVEIDGKLGINDIGQLGWFETKTREVEKQIKSYKELNNYIGKKLTLTYTTSITYEDRYYEEYAHNPLFFASNYQIISGNITRALIYGEEVADGRVLILIRQYAAQDCVIKLMDTSDQPYGYTIDPNFGTSGVISFTLDRMGSANDKYIKMFEDIILNNNLLIVTLEEEYKVFHPFFEDVEVTLEVGQEVEGTEYLYNLIKNFRLGSTIHETTMGYKYNYQFKSLINGEVSYDYCVASIGITTDNEISLYSYIAVRKDEETGKYYYICNEN